MNSTPFRQIGKGFCGSVWASDRDGPSIAIKREDGGPERSVANDSAMHMKIECSLQHAQKTLGLATQVLIPHHYALVTADDSAWWSSRASRFPFGYEHCTSLLTERILPLQQEARENLIDMFCLEKAKEAVKKNRQDEDCLVRPYLGRRTHNSAPSRFFTLRNKPLCVDQMESIGLAVEDYARAIAETLAVIYWHSKTDANDIEIVIAPGRTNDGSGDFHSEVLGRHALWVLDFDCVKSLTQDEAGIGRAASTYMRNDPFWPRPGSDVQADQSLWNIFRARFLESSRLILDDDSQLPQMFIDRLELLGEQRRERERVLELQECSQQNSS
ncbi:uncharacterized protein RCC_06300 [Ramularia collo-cygni]|uniref:DUF3669 domain-containing protein n=1 Tax=Ramularia collo-cygni TaxID=112498 RepID=A0A2D3V4R4_9PEZI|nr:uncharacterized protein RCC_06300 [Ramularia collo-cygni]CZT20440.1 uncharacterized protein RCC_06300 [Ramularia collo-cygni]